MFICFILKKKYIEKRCPYKRSCNEAGHGKLLQIGGVQEGTPRWWEHWVLRQDPGNTFGKHDWHPNTFALGFVARFCTLPTSCTSALVDRAYKNELVIRQIFPFRMGSRLSKVIKTQGRYAIAQTFGKHNPSEEVTMKNVFIVHTYLEIVFYLLNVS